MPTVADVLIDTLLAAAVPRLFGVAEAGVLVESARARGLPVVRCHQESAACVMAAVTGELTGQPGAAWATAGAGVTASITGLTHALLDRTPMIFLTEALSEESRSPVDHGALPAAVVKDSLRVGAESASHWAAHAVQLALRDPCGPVHLDVPAGLGRGPTLPMALSVTPPDPAPPDLEALDRAAALIQQARRPLVIVGRECRGADTRWLRAFVESMPTPVLATAKAKGAIPDPHPLSMGVLTGGALDQPLLTRADLIIAVGVDRLEMVPGLSAHGTPILRLGRSAAGESGQLAAEVVGDLGGMFEELAPRLGRKSVADWDVAWVDRIRRERGAALEIAVPGLAPHRVVQLARELTEVGAIATVDPGAHAWPATAYWQATEVGEFLIGTGLGAPGFALPAAIGAQLCHPDRRVICFTDAVGLLAAAAELETAARLRLPIVVVALVGEPADLAALARAFAIEAFVGGSEAEIGRALVAAQTRPGPALIEARVDPSGSRRLLDAVGVASPSTRGRGRHEGGL
jgi:acetolactate synthase-1/2/3 large subunit